MARRTKEDAQATRNRLLDAAEEVFHGKGVSGASLTDVAQAASVTRGAIYWHFKDKVDLFEAMMQRVTLPFEQAWSGAPGTNSAIVGVLAMMLKAIHTDQRARRVFEIALFKMEHVGEFTDIRERRMLACNSFIAEMERELSQAAEAQQVVLPVSAEIAAKGLHAVFDGVLQSWLLRQGGFDLERDGMAIVRLYLKGLGLQIFEDCQQISRNLPKTQKSSG